MAENRANRWLQAPVPKTDPPLLSTIRIIIEFATNNEKISLYQQVYIEICSIAFINNDFQFFIVIAKIWPVISCS